MAHVWGNAAMLVQASRGQLLDLMDRFDKAYPLGAAVRESIERDKRFSEGQRSDLLKGIHRHPREEANDFIATLDHAQSVVVAVDEKLGELNRYQRHLPRWFFILPALLLGAGAFAFGVAYPLLHSATNISTTLVAGLPIGFYAFAFLWLMAGLISSYRREGRERDR
jgi:hypothetical protein